MATIATPIPGDQWVVFDDVPWDTYLSLLKSRGERHVRLTYYRGVLEIMTLSKLHEILSEALDNFVNSVDLQSFVDRRGTKGEIALDDELAKWVRASLKKPGLSP
ncbi:MAG TPA: hypothetical protein VF306_05395 [Pirellulales bacterium]